MNILLIAAALALPFGETTVEVEKDNAIAEFAAKELNTIVTKAAGRGFEMVADDKGSAAKAKIFIRRDDSYEDEESAVFDKDGNLYLVGGGQLGCLYAVYDFLEDNLNFRHYFPADDGWFVDKCDQVTFKGTATRKRPAFTGYRKDHHDNAKKALFEVRNRCNSTNCERLLKGYKSAKVERIPGHGFNPFLLPPYDPKYHSYEIGVRGCFKEHPEWFSLGPDGKRHDDMQVCLSNPEARQKIFENLLRWINDRGKGIYMVGSNDNHNTRYCFCDGCIALEKKYNSVGGPLWDFIFWACAELEKRGYEDVYIASLAYKGPTQTERAPAGVEKMPKNFVCDAAFLNSDRSLAEVPDMTLEDGTVFNRIANLRNWTRLCDHVSYWYYGGLNISQTWRRMQKEMKELRDAGVKSVGSCGVGGDYAFRDMYDWVFFRLLQDPDFDVVPDVKRMLAIKFGPAAETEFEYLEAFEALRAEAVKKLPITTGCDAPCSGFSYLEGKDILALRKILDRALDIAKGTDYEAAVLESRISLNVFTITFFHKIKAFDPEAAAKIDYAALDAESRKAYENMAKRGRGHSTYPATAYLDEMANYANLKSDELPPELAKYPKEKVFRILPPRKAQFVCGGIVPNVYTAYEDPTAIAGWAWMDTIKDSYDLSKGIGIDIYSDSERQWLVKPDKCRIPVDGLSADHYTLVRLTKTRLPNRVCIVFAGLWASPTSISALGRLFDPSFQYREWEIWADVKLDGRKLSIQQLFAVDMGVPEGK